VKKLIALIAVLLMTLTAFAGPYFVLENSGLALAPALTVGVDWETTIGDVFTGPSFGGDFSIGYANMLAPIAINNLWDVALAIDIDWGAVRCEFDSAMAINPQLYPNNIEIVPESYFEVKTIGVLGIVEVWGGIRLEYAPILWSYPPFVPTVADAWELSPFFGIEVHLD